MPETRRRLPAGPKAPIAKAGGSAILKKGWPFAFLIFALSWIAFQPGAVDMRLEATMLLAFSIALLVYVRRNVASLLLVLFTVHVIYSIAVSFYFLPDRFAMPLVEAADPATLAIGLRLLWLVPCALAALPATRLEFDLAPRGQSGLVFWPMIALLGYILVFEIDRASDGGDYTVKISPLYEYSFLFVLLCACYADRRRGRLAMLLLVAGAIIVQDAYYGGRVTSVQVLFILAVTVLHRWITPVRALVGSLIGTLGASMIGMTRGLLAGEEIGVRTAFGELIGERLLVSDTAQYSFYASLTHIAASGYATAAEHGAAAKAFFLQIFVGGQQSVTEFVSLNYLHNEGGGLFPTHFYFWGGALAAVAACLVLALVVWFANAAPSPLRVLWAMAIVASVPRWLLYSPPSVFRSLLLISIVSLVLSLLGLGLARRASAPEPPEPAAPMHA